MWHYDNEQFFLQEKENKSNETPKEEEKKENKDEDKKVSLCHNLNCQYFKKV